MNRNRVTVVLLRKASTNRFFSFLLLPAAITAGGT